MPTSVKITTPMPTIDQTAHALGIRGERKKRILRMADEMVLRYQKRGSKAAAGQNAVVKAGKTDVWKAA